MGPLINNLIELYRHSFPNASEGTLFVYGFLFSLVPWGGMLIRNYWVRVKTAPINRILNAAKEAFETRNYVRSGELYEKADWMDDAVDAYKEGGAYHRVAYIYERKGQWVNSAKFYQMANDSEKAAMMFQKGGQYAAAALQYKNRGDMIKAAAMYEVVQDWVSVGEIHEARLHAFRQKTPYVTNESEEGKEFRKMANMAGEAYLKAKAYKRAVELFSEGGLYEIAAEAAVLGGEKEKAAQLYLDLRQFEKVISLYGQIGKQQEGYRLVAKQLQSMGETLAAIDIFKNGECWIDTAELYEKMGEKEQAAEMFMKGGDYHYAGELFLFLENWESAALAFAKGGRFQEASDLFLRLDRLADAARMLEQVGSYYEAAQLFKQHDQFDDAIPALKKVTAASPHYYPAMLMLGSLLSDKGMTNEALSHYQEVISKEVFSIHTTEFHYQMALLYEKKKEYEEAHTLYENILSENHHYKDVRARNDVIKKALTVVKKAMETQMVTRRETTFAIPKIVSVGETSRYTLLKKIGEGGMGAVYKAEDAFLKRVVAYKRFHDSITSKEGILDSLLQEARIAASLNHPNLVTLYDAGNNDGGIFITMEFIDGVTLKNYLETNHPSLSELIGMMQEICQGVAYAHDHNVIHRDLKPENVMVTADHRIKIMDFGLSKFASEAKTTTQSVLLIKGTPLYMAPEQILGNEINYQTDIYSLGCTFYRMIVGHPPFTEGDIYYQHLHASPISPRILNPSLSDGIVDIVMRCLEKEGKNRFTSVTEIITLLEQMV